MELRIEGLTKQYGQKKALDAFSVTFTEGLYGILGANGAGKSTLMNLITDNISRTSGTRSDRVQRHVAHGYDHESASAF